MISRSVFFVNIISVYRRPISISAFRWRRRRSRRRNYQTTLFRVSIMTVKYKNRFRKMTLGETVCIVCFSRLRPTFSLSMKHFCPWPWHEYKVFAAFDFTFNRGNNDELEISYTNDNQIRPNRHRVSSAMSAHLCEFQQKIRCGASLHCGVAIDASSLRRIFWRKLNEKDHVRHDSAKHLKWKRNNKWFVRASRN